MKKLSSIFSLAILLAVLPACAQPHYHGPHRHNHHHHGGYNGGWIAPFILGAGATYILTRPTPAPVIQQSPPIILQPGQQLVCRSVQVYNSYRGVYEDRQECWAQ